MYRRWRPALRSAGTYPPALALAARELEEAASADAEPEVARRLRALASEIRRRRPPAPPGMSPEIHALLLERVFEIERHSLDDHRDPPIPEGP